MESKDTQDSEVEERLENLKYEIAQEVGLNYKDEIEPPDSEQKPPSF